MTRHQVWKARERARFRVIAEAARVGLTLTDTPRAGSKPPRLVMGEKYRRLNDALIAALRPYAEARRLGIPEPFLG